MFLEVFQMKTAKTEKKIIEKFGIWGEMCKKIGKSLFIALKQKRQWEDCDLFIYLRIEGRGRSSP